MKHPFRRVCSALLAVSLLFTLLPAQALAEEASEPVQDTVTELPVQAELLPAESESESESAAGTEDPSLEPSEEEPEPPAEPELPEAAEEEPEPALLAGEVQTTADGLQYTVADGAATVTGYTGSAAALTIPETLGGAAVTAIGNGAFRGNQNLTRVTLPSGLKSIGDDAFSSCKQLAAIDLPEGLEFIGTTAFWHCEALKSVKIPVSVTGWGGGNGLHFADCYSLASLELPEGLTTLGTSAFANCRSLTSITIPSTLQSVRFSGGPFANCANLHEVHFGAGIPAIPNVLFKDCTGLTEIDLPDTVTSIGASAFNGCTNLTTIDLPEGLEFIGTTAFCRCEALKSVKIPASVTGWGDSSGSHFADCYSLTSLELPEGLTTLGTSAFANCRSLTSITIPSTLQSVRFSGGPFANCANLHEVHFGAGIPAIPNVLFKDCTGLTEIDLPETVTRINSGAFDGCTNLTRVTLPDGLKRIETDAFNACKQLAAIDLPEGLEFIGTAAFWHCEALKSVKIPASVTGWGDGNGLHFADCYSLTSVELPEGLTSLGLAAFSNCTALPSITIPSTLQGVTFSGRPFANCHSLRTVRFGDGITAIPGVLFKECTGLREIALPETVTAIGTEAFRECTNLTRVSLPAGLEYIGNGAFAFCRKLTAIDLPEGLNRFGQYAFWECDALTSVRIPSSVTIWEGLGSVFLNCDRLNTVILSQGLPGVGKNAFSGCPNLRSILVEDRATTFGYRSLDGIGSQTVIYCPFRSEATAAAIDWQIPFRATDSASQDGGRYELDCGQSSLYADLNGMTANGCITFTVKYALKSSSTAAPSRLQVRLPNNVELAENSVTLNGSDYTGYYVDRNNQYLWYFPVTGTSGVLRFRGNLKAMGNLLGYARLEMRQGNTTIREVAGVINEQFQLLTLNLPELTSKCENVSASGIAPASAQVTLSVNGNTVGTVTASKAGNWSAKINLPSSREDTSYTVTASCVSGTQTLTQQASILYQKDAPVLTGLELTYNMHGQTLHTVLMGEDSTARPKVYFMPRTPFRFDVTFENPEQAESVCVTSTRGGEKKFLEAVYDQKLGRYVAQGFFDPDNLNYVPGQIRVEYTPKIPKVNYTQEDLENLVPKTGLTTDNLTNVTFNKSTKTTTAQVDVGPLIEGIDKLVFDTSVSVFDETTGTDLDSIFSGVDEVLSLVRFLDGNNKEMEAQICSMEGEEAYVTIIHNITDSTYTKWVLKEIEASTSGGQVAGMDIFDIADGISKTSMVSGIIANEYKLNREVEDLRAEILSNTSLNDAQRAEAEKRLKGYAHDKSVFQMATTLLPLVVAAAGATGGGAALLVFSGILGMMTATSSFFWDYRVGQIKGEIHTVNWVVDPSGYVYDSDTGERLEGVTTTAYYVSAEDGEEPTEANKPANDACGTVWDASEYDQANPLTTDIDGRYAWDVPQGWWRVKYEKAGYETTWSDWLPVPPPQTEVNIGMKPLVSSQCTARITGWTGSAANIEVTNRAREPVSLLFAAAAYKNGQMVVCRTENRDLTAGESFQLSLPVTGDDSTELRCFFLTPGTGKPLTRSFKDYWRE